MDVGDKCIARTLKGTRCTRNATAANRLCKQHAKSAATGAAAAAVSIIGVVEPWVQHQLPAPADDLRKHVLQKIRRQLQAGPRATAVRSASTGALYVYFIAAEAGLNYWKIGMTTQKTDTRMRQWSASHRARIGLQREYKVTRNVAFCERLVHRYLDHRRMYRYPADNGCFRSYWAATGEMISDAQSVRIDAEERLVAKNKHVEWFCLSFDEIDALVSAVVRAFGA